MSERGETTIPRNYCLHISLLHAKAIIITDMNIKRRFTWGNGRDVEKWKGRGAWPSWRSPAH